MTEPVRQDNKRCEMPDYIPQKRGFLRMDFYAPFNMLLIGVFLFVFCSRFTFGYGLLHGCLPVDMYMIDRSDKTYRTGEMIAFNMPRTVPFIKKDEKVIKIVAGIGGDKLRVTVDGVYNGKEFFAVNARRILTKYKISPSTIEKELTIPEGEVFLVGKTDYSWDSRFWGPVKLQTVIGKTYALF